MTLPSPGAATEEGKGASLLARRVAAYGLGDEESEEPGASFPRRPLGGEQWSDLLAEAKSQRILGLLWSAVADGALAATAEQAAQLNEVHVDALCGELLRERVLLSTARLLSGSGLDHRVLKGPAVAHLDYPDPALRSFADIDLLVRSDQWDDAVGLLRTARWEREFPEPRPGFDRRFSKGVAFRHPQLPAELDLHRTLAFGPFGLSVRLEDLWDNSQPLTLGEETLQALDAVGRFLQSCFTAVLFFDDPPRLVPQRDIAQMLLSGRVDLDRAIRVARSWEAEAVLRRGIEVAWEALGLDPSDEAVQRIRSLRVPPRQLKALDVYLLPGRSYVGLCVAATRAISRPSDKVRYLSALAFPRRAFLSPRYASRSRRWLVAARQLGSGSRRSQAASER